MQCGIDQQRAIGWKSVLGRGQANRAQGELNFAERKELL